MHVQADITMSSPGPNSMSHDDDDTKETRRTQIKDVIKKWVRKCSLSKSSSHL